jgi:hypothetical protein
VTGFNTVGTDRYFFYPAAGKGTHSLQIWIKATFGDIMRMADMMSNHWFLTADFASF